MNISKNRLWDALFLFTSYPKNICTLPWMILGSIGMWLIVSIFVLMMLAVSSLLPFAAFNFGFALGSDPAMFLASFVIWAVVGFILGSTLIDIYKESSLYSETETEPNVVAEYIRAKKGKYCLELNWK